MKKLTFIRLLLITVEEMFMNYEDDGFKEKQYMKTEE